LVLRAAPCLKSAFFKSDRLSSLFANFRFDRAWRWTIARGCLEPLCSLARLDLFLTLSLLLSHQIPLSLFLPHSCTLFRQLHGFNLALTGQLRGLEPLPVRFFNEVHVNQAHLNDIWGFMGGWHWLGLFGYHTPSVFRAKGDVLVHPLVFLL